MRQVPELEIQFPWVSACALVADVLERSSR